MILALVDGEGPTPCFQRRDGPFPSAAHLSRPTRPFSTSGTQGIRGVESNARRLRSGLDAVGDKFGRRDREATLLRQGSAPGLASDYDVRRTHVFRLYSEPNSSCRRPREKAETNFPVGVGLTPRRQPPFGVTSCVRFCDHAVELCWTHSVSDHLVCLTGARPD